MHFVCLFRDNFFLVKTSVKLIVNVIIAESIIELTLKFDNENGMMDSLKLSEQNVNKKNIQLKLMIG